MFLHDSWNRAPREDHPAFLPPAVLIVDEDCELTDLLAFALERDGFQVSTACTRERALEAIVRENPHVAVVDGELCARDGLELVQQMERLDVEVILLTKPFSYVDLTGQLKRCGQGIHGRPLPGVPLAVVEAMT